MLEPRLTGLRDDAELAARRAVVRPLVVLEQAAAPAGEGVDRFALLAKLLRHQVLVDGARDAVQGLRLDLSDAFGRSCARPEASGGFAG